MFYYKLITSFIVITIIADDSAASVHPIILSYHVMCWSLLSVESSDSSSDSDSDSDPEKDNKFASALFMTVSVGQFNWKQVADFRKKS